MKKPRDGVIQRGAYRAAEVFATRYGKQFIALLIDPRTVCHAARQGRFRDLRFRDRCRLALRSPI